MNTPREREREQNRKFTQAVPDPIVNLDIQAVFRQYGAEKFTAIVVRFVLFSGRRPTGQVGLIPVESV